MKLSQRTRAAAWLLTLFIAGCAGDARQTSPATARAPSPPAQYAAAAAVESLAAAIDDRLAAMQDVAAAKWVSGAPILDPAREQAVLQQVGASATDLGLDVAATQAFFAAQMGYARDLQQRLHDDWKAAGACAPCRNPQPLPAVRERIDAANASELAALRVLAPMDPSDRAALQAALARTRVAHGPDAAQTQQLVELAGAVTPSSARAALERIRAAGVLRIGTTGDYAPFSLEAGGYLTGADIELSRRLAARLGVEPVYIRTRWSTLAQDLAARRFDVAMSGVSWTEDRAAIGAYSQSYHSGGKTLLARCSERKRFDEPADLDREGVRVIVNPGGTNERWVREHVHVATIVVYPDNRGVFEQIAAGRADVMVTDDVEAELQARRRPGVLCRTYPGTLTHGDKRVLMLRDQGLQAAVDDWLAAELVAGEPRRALEQAMDDYVRHPPAP